MNLRIGNKVDENYILKIRPHAAPLFERKSYFIVAEDEEMLGFAVVIRRNIETPIPIDEAFINLIEILDEKNYRKGIGSLLIQKIIEMEKMVYQVRAYCEISNVASHMLWFKNGFGISPIKEPTGRIIGSYVTYVNKQ